MIEVTNEMIDVAARFFHPPPFPMNVRAGLEAVLALIDPVPADVRKARIVQLDWEFTRIVSGEDQDVPVDLYRGECGCHFYTHRQIVEAAALEESEVQWS